MLNEDLWKSRSEVFKSSILNVKVATKNSSKVSGDQSRASVKPQSKDALIQSGEELEAHRPVTTHAHHSSSALLPQKK